MDRAHQTILDFTLLQSSFFDVKKKFNGIVEAPNEDFTMAQPIGVIKMKKLFISATLVLCSGCAIANYGKFSIASTKPVDFSRTYTKSESPVKGKDVGHIIVIFPTKTLHIADAVKDALNKANAAFLTDAEIKVKLWLVPFYAKVWIEVTGDAWRQAN